ncbi:unnamed protein product, partial [Meganyctiphanes norvegica]
AFVDFFSQALSVECEGTGVLIQGVHPGFVRSKMSKPLDEMTSPGKLKSFLFPTADTYVESALSTVGHADYTHGYWGHSLHRAISKTMMALPFKANLRFLLKTFKKTREQLLH